MTTTSPSASVQVHQLVELFRPLLVAMKERQVWSSVVQTYFLTKVKLGGVSRDPATAWPDAASLAQRRKDRTLALLVVCRAVSGFLLALPPNGTSPAMLPGEPTERVDVRATAQQARESVEAMAARILSEDNDDTTAAAEDRLLAELRATLHAALASMPPPLRHPGYAKLWADLQAGLAPAAISGSQPAPSSSSSSTIEAPSTPTAKTGSLLTKRSKPPSPPRPVEGESELDVLLRTPAEPAAPKRQATEETMQQGAPVEAPALATQLNGMREPLRELFVRLQAQQPQAWRDWWRGRAQKEERAVREELSPPLPESFVAANARSSVQELLRRSCAGALLLRRFREQRLRELGRYPELNRDIHSLHAAFAEFQRMGPLAHVDPGRLRDAEIQLHQALSLLIAVGREALSVSAS